MERLPKPKIAVLLAAYNGLDWIPEQVDSILAQNEVDVALFVSVDRSDDGTEAWFDRLAAGDQRVTVLPHGRHFGGAARNFFRLLTEADFSEFDFVSFADQDDVWYETKLARAVAVLQAGDYDGYSSNVTAFWPDGRQKLVDKAQPQKKWDYLFEAAGPGCSYVLRKSLADSIRTTIRKNSSVNQSVYLHDWLFYACARACCRKWYIDHEPSLLYRQHASNQVGVNSGFKALSQRMSTFTSGFWLNQAGLIASIVGVSDTKFVKTWERFDSLGLLRLGLNARACRRRRRDQLFFFILCVALAAKSCWRIN